MAEAIAKTLEDVLANVEAQLASPEEVARWERAQSAERHASLLRDCGIAEVLTDEGTTAVVRDRCVDTRSLSIVRAWLASQRPILALFGPKGVGKTVAAAWALARTPGRYIEAQPMCIARKAHYGSPTQDYERCIRTELLVLDELGTESNAEDAIAMLHDVVNRRQRLPRRTLLLGNLDKHTFTARYDERTIDRLREAAVIRAVHGESMRKGSL